MMTPIPVVATSYDNPNDVKFFNSVREAARSFGSEESIRKTIAAACNEDIDGGVELKTPTGNWYIEYFSSYVNR